MARASGPIEDIDPSKLVKDEENIPDSWIPRHPELIRLTGNQPFNAEPPADLLMNSTITPTAFHYVRNHGAVPRLEWGSHKLRIEGLVQRPMTLSMDELAQFPTIVLPVTLTCDGNRRKELNQIKRGKGFDWGAGATSCAIWRGVPLVYLLEKAGIKSEDDNDKRRAKFVCFEGAETLHKGKYGTSIPISWAMDVARDIMVAIEMNGERLPPDHGFPCRMVMPGMVGGRMVKWLAKIIVSEEESDSWYHWHDNKVLPPTVDITTANLGGWFWRTGYTLYELNINSVITSPKHNEWIRADDPLMAYTLRGYAYSGGGRRITRVEVSFDGGNEWEMAEFDYPDHVDIPRHQTRFWTWVHWAHRVEKWRLIHAREVIVRAVDESLNTQPSDRTWNLHGMMNNSWYRVKISAEASSSAPTKEELPRQEEAEETERKKALHRHELEQRRLMELGKGQPHVVSKPPALDTPSGGPKLRHDLHPTPFGLVFTHPVLPGKNYGGWLTPPTDFEKERERTSRVAPTTVGAAARAGKTLTPSEIAKHNKEDDCWVIINGEVFDITSYVKDHPGGPEPIMLFAGKDASGIWPHIHSYDAYEIKSWFNIGTVVSEDIAAGLAEVCRKRESSLNSSRWIECKLMEKKLETHNSYRFKFKLPSLGSRPGRLHLPAGQHVLLSAEIDGQSITRPYTPVGPVTEAEEDGSIDFLIKIYRTDSHPSFSSGGIFTQYLEQRKEGDVIHMKGPTGHILYFGHGRFNINGQTVSATAVSLVAGGTGLTPMYQLVRSILSDPTDGTKIRFLFANKSTKDILMRRELDDLALKYGQRFHIWYTISQPPSEGEEWKYSIGRVNERMMLEHLHPPGPESIALVCGPPPMVIRSLLPNLIRVGFIEETIFEF